jgi:hypothetical protein
MGEEGVDAGGDAMGEEGVGVGGGEMETNRPGIQVTVGSKDEVPITEEALKLWEILVPKLCPQARRPTNMRRLLQSLVKTSKHLFGGDYWKTPELKRKRIGGDHITVTTYAVNQKWWDRQMELFRYSSFQTETSERDT